VACLAWAAGVCSTLPGRRDLPQALQVAGVDDLDEPLRSPEQAFPSSPASFPNKPGSRSNPSSADSADTTVRGADLIGGHTRSCGCLLEDYRRRGTLARHPLSVPAEYRDPAERPRQGKTSAA
jgi:hypothetical protein